MAVASARAGKEPSPSNLKEGDDPDEEGDEDEVLETKGRWQKLADRVTQREVPGIDAAHLAVDVDEGMEVVWNEVFFSSESKAKQKNVLTGNLKHLTSVKHANIVKFYEFWVDECPSAPGSKKERLVFITEYMTSGTLLQFLKKTKKNKKSVSDTTVSDKMWRRWCRQILLALNYLHKQNIVHGNLTLDTIFIQHNGLLKIGCISPQNIKNVKTSLNHQMGGGLHYIAPESGDSNNLSSAVDVYAFGICALEMLKLELLGNGDTRPKMHPDDITQAVSTLDPAHKEFVESCLRENPGDRPPVDQLLKNPIVQEVYSLFVLAGRTLMSFLKNKQLTGELLEHVNKGLIASRGEHRDPMEYSSNPDKVVALCREEIKAGSLQIADIDKCIEENQTDLFYHTDGTSGQEQADSQQPEKKEESSQQSHECVDEERKITDSVCEIKTDGTKKQLIIKLKFDANLGLFERTLCTDLKEGDSPHAMTENLVSNGLLNRADFDVVWEKIKEQFEKHQTVT